MCAVLQKQIQSTTLEKVLCFKNTCSDYLLSALDEQIHTDAKTYQKDQSWPNATNAQPGLN